MIHWKEMIVILKTKGFHSFIQFYDMITTDEEYHTMVC